MFFLFSFLVIEFRILRTITIVIFFFYGCIFIIVFFVNLKSQNFFFIIILMYIISRIIIIFVSNILNICNNFPFIIMTPSTLVMKKLSIFKIALLKLIYIHIGNLMTLNKRTIIMITFFIVCFFSLIIFIINCMFAWIYIYINCFIYIFMKSIIYIYIKDKIINLEEK